MFNVNVQHLRWIIELIRPRLPSSDKNGWICPTIYQGVQNVLERQVEAEWVHLFRSLARSDCSIT